MENNFTPEQKALMQIYSIVVAVMQSDRTPMITKLATVQTLKKILEDEDGPFASSDEMQMIAAAMADESNHIVKGWMKQARQDEGNDILAGISWN